MVPFGAVAEKRDEMHMVDLSYAVDLVEKVFLNLASWLFLELFHSDCDNTIGTDLARIGSDVSLENSSISTFSDLGLEVSSNKLNLRICESNNRAFGC